ncbi:MAG: hypothetical protein R3B95_21260, partial [Nitrospirales bacterium]|nr:hypothetical protein [Nitrospirales bacterium]
MMYPHLSTLGLGATWTAAFLCFSTQMVAAKDWRELVPLRSTSEDVAHILGVSPTGVLNNYKFKEMNVSLTYQYQAGERACQESPRYYDVPAETVVAIDLSPNYYVSLQDLFINLKNFRPLFPKDHGGNRSGFYLLDEQTGIAVTLNEDRSVDHITYLPSLPDKERFSCPDQGNTQHAAPEERQLRLSSILYSKIPNLEQRLLSNH